MWKDIKGYEGKYQISDSGNVKSLITHKYLKLVDNKGYKRVFLSNPYRRWYLVHRLVAEAFIPNPENKPTVNHIDGNKQNNCVDNLEWATYSENNIHAIKNNLRPYNQINATKQAAKMNKKAVIQYDLKGNLIKEWEGMREVERKLNIKHQYISNCCLGIQHSAKGYRWEYKKEEV